MSLPKITDPRVVTLVQFALNARGATLKIDGDWGAKTSAAFERFADKIEAPKAPAIDERSAENLLTLLPKVQVAAVLFLARLNAQLAGHGLVAKIISGTRTYAEQDALYAKGRTTPGQIVTNAKGGYSNHNFGIAFDIGLFKGKAYLPEHPLYDLAGKIGRECGLEWGGDWKSLVDKPHFEFPTGLSLAQMRARRSAGVPILT